MRPINRAGVERLARQQTHVAAGDRHGQRHREGGGGAGVHVSGEGNGGVAGFAKGGADVQLNENSDGTLLEYDVDIDISGKLAQVGSRLIEGTSKRLAKKFFTNFQAELEQRES